MFRVLLLIIVLFSSLVLALAEKKNSIYFLTDVYTLVRVREASDNDIIALFGALERALSDDNKARGCIINYGTKSQIKKRERQIKKAFSFHKINPGRVLILTERKDKELETRVYAVPKGAECPQP